jgi:hypothetical protein
MKHVSTLVALCALVALSTRPAEGQWKFGITPSFASYFPMAKLVDSVGYTEKQANAPMLGLRATYWVGREIALEVGTTVTNSKIVSEASGQLLSGSVTNKESGTLIFSSLRLVFKPARSNFFGFLGPSLILRRGDAWPVATFPDRDNIGAVIGLGARSEVTSSLSLWVSAEAHIYSADFDGSGPSGRYYSRTTQSDVLVTIGVPIGILNR